MSDDNGSNTGSGRPSWLVPAAGLGVLLLLGAAAFAFSLFNDDAPDVQDLDSVAADLEEISGDEATVTSQTAPGDETTTEVAATTEAASGTWTVDTSIGDIADETSTYVGFRIDEELTAIGDFTAVGRTPDVSGSITIDGTQLTQANFEAEMGTLETDDSRRDGQVYRALDTANFPTATFVLSGPIELGSEPIDGVEVAIDAAGELTVHGVTQEVTIPLQAQLLDDVIAVVGTLEIALADFDVEAPSAPIVVSVSDVATIEVKLLLTQA